MSHPVSKPGFGLILILLLTIVGFGHSSPFTENLPKTKFPSIVKDVHGKNLNIKKLVQKKTVVVITLKATWCLVCQEQLLRIKAKLNDLKLCNISFVVLSPGPEKELREIKNRTGFPFPFFVDHQLEISKSLGLKMAKDQIFPSLFILKKDRSIGWLQKGRNAFQFGDPILMKALNCESWI